MIKELHILHNVYYDDEAAMPNLNVCWPPIACHLGAHEFCIGHFCLSVSSLNSCSMHCIDKTQLPVRYQFKDVVQMLKKKN